MATSEQIYIPQTFPGAAPAAARSSGMLQGSFLNQRLEPRGLAVLPVVIRAEAQENVGLLRDISQTGMFFYCRLSPRVGSDLEVMIRPSPVDPSVTVRCRCRVVRIEASLPGAATGVGAEIEEYLGPEEQAESAVADARAMSS